MRRGGEAVEVVRRFRFFYSLVLVLLIAACGSTADATNTPASTSAHPILTFTPDEQPVQRFIVDFFEDFRQHPNHLTTYLSPELRRDVYDVRKALGVDPANIRTYSYPALVARMDNQWTFALRFIDRSGRRKAARFTVARAMTDCVTPCLAISRIEAAQ